MATLTEVLIDADGTIAAKIEHDAGTGTPFYTHINDQPDGLSSDWVTNDDTSNDEEIAWFSLSGVDSDFDSMTTLDIEVDVLAVDFVNDSCSVVCQIYDADNDQTNALTNQIAIHAEEKTTRVQETNSFSELAGSKTQWDAAHIRINWRYTISGGADGGNCRIYGVAINGTYATAATGRIMSRLAGAGGLVGSGGIAGHGGGLGG